MEIKQNKTIKTPEDYAKNDEIIFDNQSNFNQIYINDLTKIFKTNTVVPTHIPKKLLDCIYLYWDGATTYKLYLYINNTWKSTNLS